MLQLQGHGSQEEPGPQVMAAHALKSGQGGRVSLRHWHSGPVESNNRSLRHFISIAFYILKLKTIVTWLSPGVGRGVVGTHRAILQLQGHGSQEKPGPHVIAAHAPKSGQDGRVLLLHWHPWPVESNRIGHL